MLFTNAFCAGRDFYRVIPAVTQGLSFLRSHLKVPSNIVAFYENQGVPMTYSNLDPYGEGALTYIYSPHSILKVRGGYKSPAFDPHPDPPERKECVKRFFVSAAILSSFRPEVWKGNILIDRKLNLSIIYHYTIKKHKYFKT